MTRQRQWLLLLGVLLLLSVGLVMAQAPDAFVSQRFVAGTGATAGSANFSVVSVVGQPAVGVYSSAGYRNSAGFLTPATGGSLWIPAVFR